METFIINEVKPNGSVDVTFSVDKKKQNISGLPVHDKDELIKELNKYAVAYKYGLEKTAVSVAPEVAEVVGKPQSVTNVESNGEEA